MNQLPVIPRGFVGGCAADTCVSYMRTWRAVRLDQWDHIAPEEEVALRRAMARRMALMNRPHEPVS